MITNLGADDQQKLLSLEGQVQVDGVQPSARIPEASMIDRSDMASKIRQSFDALVKASPIGIPLVSVEPI